MPPRKTLIKAQAGVRLQRIEELSARQKVLSQTYRLSTYREVQPRTFGDERDAEDAFDLEVVASLNDPVVVEMQRRGMLD